LKIFLFAGQGVVHAKRHFIVLSTLKAFIIVITSCTSSDKS